jgi:hypothetical protein
MLLLLVAVSVFSSGCALTGTVSPKAVVNRVAGVDVSTPPQYDKFNDGFIRYVDIDGRQYGVFTQARKQAYELQIDKYLLQYKDIYLISLDPSKGISVWTDEYGNALWAFDGTHTVACFVMSQWQKDGKPGDSLWRQALEKAGL